MPRFVTAVILALLAGTTAAVAQPLTSTFTYQGELLVNGSALSGDADLQFRLFDSPSGGVQIGSTLRVTGTTVTAGHVTALLDFGAAPYSGSRRWIEISVRAPAGTGIYTPLTPRQELTASPYALYSPQSGNSSTLSGQTGSFYTNAGNLTGTVVDARLTANIPKLNAPNTFTGATTFSGAATFSSPATFPGTATFLNSATFSGPAFFTNPASSYLGDGSGLSGLWRLGGNAGLNPSTQFIGTTDAVPVVVRANNARALALTSQLGVTDTVLATHVNTANVLAGAAVNRIDNNAHGAVVGGGGMDRYEQGSPDAAKNIAGADFATVSGGGGNYAGTRMSSVVGGEFGRIDGQSTGAFLGGGSQRTITSLGLYSVIVGGYNQVIDSAYSSILGGSANAIHASNAVIGGGVSNTVRAGADWSTIAGGVSNQSYGPYSVIGGGGPIDGGPGNTVFDAYGVVAGGASNTVGTNDGDVNSKMFGVIGGGKGNGASGYASVVGGGDSNQAGEDDAVVTGGAFNAALGVQSWIGGGYLNTSRGIAGSLVGGQYNTVTDYGFIGGGQANLVTGTNAVVVGGFGGQASGYDAFVGGGAGNLAESDYCFIGGGWNNLAQGEGASVVSGWNNHANGDWGVIGGGRENATGPHECTVAGGRANTADGLNSSVGGGYRNHASGAYAAVPGGNFNLALADFAVIAGGGPTDTTSDSTSANTNNRVFDAYGTIGGGGGNRAGSDDNNPSSALYTTIGGGKANTASAYGATIAGGDSNAATGNVSFIGGGTYNVASGLQAFVGSGQSNTASGLRSCVIGGENNTAFGGHAVCLGGSNNYAGSEGALVAGLNSFVTGNYSLALGRYASATHDNSFVWNAGYTGLVGDTGPGQFVVQADGGVAFNAPPTIWTDFHIKNRPNTSHTFSFFESDTNHRGILLDVFQGAAADQYSTLELSQATIVPNSSSRFIRVVLQSNGDLFVGGTIRAGAKQFLIDHPLDPANKTLSHTCVESPDMKTIYDGVVTTDGSGYADITLPDYFQALNADYRYQLTVLDESDGPDFVWAKVVRKIDNNSFAIRTSRGGVEVSWQVTGIRTDPFARAHRTPVEAEKAPADRGKYLHPEAWGRPATDGTQYRIETATPSDSR